MRRLAVRRRSGARSTDPASGTATAVDGARNTRPERPGSLPQMTKGNGKRSTASGAPRIKGVKVSAASSTEKMARRAQQKVLVSDPIPSHTLPSAVLLQRDCKGCCICADSRWLCCTAGQRGSQPTCSKDAAEAVRAMLICVF
eukprot:SAG31_NODE_64_length_28590_cov_17.914464_20_plen_143_part_00